MTEEGTAKEILTEREQLINLIQEPSRFSDGLYLRLILDPTSTKPFSITERQAKLILSNVNLIKRFLNYMEL